jgi:hypothetical protein
LPQNSVLRSLQANWANGTSLANQKEIAKSLIKLHLSAGNAPALAVKTNVDPVILTEVAVSIVSGVSLTQRQVDLYQRFDLILAALLDEAYQNADHAYRNGMRTLAAVVAVALALTAGWVLAGGTPQFWFTRDAEQWLLIGLLATPVAPIAKDVSTAVASAVKSKIQKAL